LAKAGAFCFISMQARLLCEIKQKDQQHEVMQALFVLYTPLQDQRS